MGSAHPSVNWILSKLRFVVMVKDNNKCYRKDKAISLTSYYPFSTIDYYLVDKAHIEHSKYQSTFQLHKLKKYQIYYF